jgi:diacylglycerol diphosphate phosphatase / phosphatidate phosphatase
MRLFNRRTRPVGANTATSMDPIDTPTTAPTGGNGATREKTGFIGMLHGRHNGTYPETRNSRPTFGQWIKQTWIDIITMVILGAIGLGVLDLRQTPLLRSC